MGVGMSSVRWLSPLRYPGGKGRMASTLAEVFQGQFGLLDVEVWVEPFAGGAGAGLHLLERGVVEEVWLTEKNRALAAFWRTVVGGGDELAARVRLASRICPLGMLRGMCWPQRKAMPTLTMWILPSRR